MISCSVPWLALAQQIRLGESSGNRIQTCFAAPGCRQDPPVRPHPAEYRWRQNKNADPGHPAPVEVCSYCRCTNRGSTGNPSVLPPAGQSGRPGSALFFQQQDRRFVLRRLPLLGLRHPDLGDIIALFAGGTVQPNTRVVGDDGF